MFGGFNLFKSKEEIKKQETEYKNKIFPFGDDHKNKISEFLKENISSKVVPQDKLFFYIITKENILKEEIPDYVKLFKYLKKRKLFSDYEVKFLISLAILDIEISDLNNFPDKNKIIEKFETINFNLK